jgi:hypothetical protein
MVSLRICSVKSNQRHHQLRPPVLALRLLQPHELEEVVMHLQRLRARKVRVSIYSTSLLSKAEVLAVVVHAVQQQQLLLWRVLQVVRLGRQVWAISISYGITLSSSNFAK